MFKKETIQVPYDIANQKYAHISLEYKDESKLKWLQHEFFMIFSYNEFSNIDNLVAPINKLLSTVDINDLIVHEIKYDSKSAQLKNNLFMSSYEVSEDFSRFITNYSYRMDKNNKTNITEYFKIIKMFGVSFNKTKKNGTCIYLMFFVSGKDERVIMHKTIFFENDEITQVNYDLLDLRIYVEFKKSVQINYKEIEMTDNEYNVDESSTISMFFDFESNENIRRLFDSREMWTLKYKTSVPIIDSI